MPFTGYALKNKQPTDYSMGCLFKAILCFFIFALYGALLWTFCKAVSCILRTDVGCCIPTAKFWMT